MHPTTPYRSHGDGSFQAGDFRALGANVVFEAGVQIFHAGTISLGNNLYIGHRTILKGYHLNELVIGDDTWIGQNCFFHSAGGIRIGARVGIGPGVSILTSTHREEGRQIAILQSDLDLAPVTLEDDCDIGVGAIILPGVTIGKGAQVGAGAVVTESIPPYAISAGVPARVLRFRPA